MPNGTLRTPPSAVEHSLQSLAVWMRILSACPLSVLVAILTFLFPTSAAGVISKSPDDPGLTMTDLNDRLRLSGVSCPKEIRAGEGCGWRRGVCLF